MRKVVRGNLTRPLDHQKLDIVNMVRSNPACYTSASVRDVVFRQRVVFAVKKNREDYDEIPKLYHSQLKPVLRALEAWRKTCRHRQRIPETLWSEMAILARTHGVGSVSRSLRLDYYALKRRASEQVPAADFVEVKFAPADHPPRGCTAELEDRQGRRLLLRWSSAPGPELLGVVQAFWNQSA